MKLKIFYSNRMIYAILYFGVFFNSNSVIIGQNTKLNKGQMNEVKELLILVDVIDIKLRKIWNSENDYGLATEKDKTYFENVQNVSLQISGRARNLPQGDYLNYLTYSLIGYLDVGMMRLLTANEGGYDKQFEIANRYKIQDTEPHLWAYTIWQIARQLRNLSANELKLPLNNYSEN